MNEYQKRNAEERNALRKELEPIVAAMGEGWTLTPDTERDITSSNGFSIEGPTINIWTRLDWNKHDRLRFHACGWPTYETADGKTAKITPRDNWRNKERCTTPETTAARSRAPEAIAKQVIKKVIEPALTIYAELQDATKERQSFQNTEKNGIEALFKATREKRLNPEQKPRYVEDIKGSNLYLDFQSAGNVQLCSNAWEMAEIIEFVREKRTKQCG